MTQCATAKTLNTPENPWAWGKGVNRASHLPEGDRPKPAKKYEKGWESLFMELVKEYSANFAEVKNIILQESRILNLENEVSGMKEEIGELRTLLSNDLFCVIPINTFAPEHYLLNKEISVLIRNLDGEYIASFVDANINVSGDTITEAFQDLKNIILDIYDDLSKTPHDKMGSEIKQQWKVLSSFIEKE